MPARPYRAALLLAPPLALAACSSGGDEDRLQSEVLLASSHHLFGFVGKPQFPAFPVTTNDVLTYDQRFGLTTSGNYERFDTQGNPVPTDRYSLAADGELGILVPTQAGLLLYRGALELLSVQPPGSAQSVLYGRDVFLTDRIGEAVGLYVGTERLAGPADRASFAGAWHVFTIHALFAESTATPDFDRVGLAFAGDLTLAADGSFSGAGVESEADTINVRGSAGEFMAFDDGRIGMEILYDPTSKPDYERGFSGGGTARVLFGVDTNNGGNDTAAGLLAMLRYRTQPMSMAALAGTYDLGLLTLFLRPDASGTDSAIGTLQITAAGDFLLEARNNTGQDFDYRGTITATDDGALTFQVTQPTNETWHGAVDELFQNLVLLDPFKEQRGNGQVELNFGVGIRPRTPI